MKTLKCQRTKDREPDQFLALIYSYTNFLRFADSVLALSCQIGQPTSRAMGGRGQLQPQSRRAHDSPLLLQELWLSGGQCLCLRKRSPYIHG